MPEELFRMDLSSGGHIALHLHPSVSEDGVTYPPLLELLIDVQGCAAGIELDPEQAAALGSALRSQAPASPEEGELPTSSQGGSS